MSKRFEVMDDTATADVCIKVYGKDLSKLFENAAYGMFSVMANISNVKKHITMEFTVTAKNKEALLVNFLNELVYLWDTSKTIFTDFNCSIHTENNFKLDVKVKGEKYKPDKHQLNTEIKAATYFGLDIKKLTKQYVCTLTLDI